MANIGYARVSTEDQHLELQLDALTKYGCEKIFQEKKSGKNAQRPQLKAMFEYLRPGDNVIVWKLDRLGRSMQDLINLTQEMNDKGIGFVSIKDSIDMSTATGRLYFHLMSALAEFERDLIRERTLAGLQAARERGNVGGRPRADESKLKDALTLFNAGGKSVRQICEEFSISESTFYRYKRTQKEQQG